MTYTLKYINALGKEIEFSMSSGFVIAEATGLTSNSIETYKSQGNNQVGAVLLGQSVQPRTINIQGTIFGKSLLGRRKLLETIAPEIPAKLIFNDMWQIDVYPIMTPDIARSLENTAFAFALEATFPYWQSVEETMTLLSGIQAMFKFPWNLTLPWKFGINKETFFTNVYNEGNVATNFDLVFYANTEVDNPKVTKVDTLEFIAFNHHMVAGETVILSMSSNSLLATSIIDGVETDIFSDLDYDNTYFLLEIGDNVLRHDADYNREGLDCKIYHRTTTVGAYI